MEFYIGIYLLIGGLTLATCAFDDEVRDCIIHDPASTTVTTMLGIIILWPWCIYNALFGGE